MTCTLVKFINDHPQLDKLSGGRKPSVFFLVRMRGGKGAGEGKEKYVCKVFVPKRNASKAECPRNNYTHKNIRSMFMFYM